MKLNSLGSLKIIAAVFALFVCLGAPSVIAQIINQQDACKFLAAQNSRPCEKWTYDYDANNPEKYKTLFWNNCDDSYGFLTCYWNTAAAACKAQITDHNKEVAPSAQWSFVKAVMSSGDSDIYECRHKIPGSSTIFRGIVVRFEPVHFFPYQLHCDTEVNGPYRNCSDQFTLCGTMYSEAKRGFGYTTTQRNLVKQTNKNNNGMKLKSDLAGFSYPKPANESCIKADPNNPQMCREPDFLEQTNHAKDKAEVHHVVPKKDRQGCSCGKNSMKNAAVISKQLNLYLLNFRRPEAEISMINAAGQSPYPCSSQIAPQRNSSGNKISGQVKKSRKRHR